MSPGDVENPQILSHYPSTDCESPFRLGDFSSKSLRFRSKLDLDPQRLIFNRFRRAGARFPSQTLYPTVMKGHGQSEIDKNRLSRPNRARRPRANISLSYHAEDPRDENGLKKYLIGLNND